MRHILYKYLTGASMIALTFSLNTNTASATCSAMPTCEELGYNRTNCGDMAGGHGQWLELKCPFDEIKRMCIPDYSDDCENFGYNQRFTACRGGDFLTCPYDDGWVKCLCNIDEYPLTSCDSMQGTCARCGNRYKYVTCRSGVYNYATGTCGSAGTTYMIGSIYRYNNQPVGIIYDVTETVSYYEISLLSAMVLYDTESWLDPDLEDGEEIWEAFERIGMCTEGAPANATGKQLTQTIINNCSDHQPWPALDAHDYYPSVCGPSGKTGCPGRGEWWLPSESEIRAALGNEAIITSFNSLQSDDEHKISYIVFNHSQSICVGNGYCEFWTSTEGTETEAIGETRLSDGSFEELWNKDEYANVVAVTKLKVNK